MPLCPSCRTQCEEGIPICPVDGTPLSTRDMTGRVLGERYRVLQRLGEGGMGTVYLCEHVTLGRKMAVKLLRPEFCSDEELVRRFQQEAQAASRIGQENIVDVLDFGRTPDGSLYFVMEALEGESLATLLQRERLLPPRRALPILTQICRALGAAHGRGIVHRDLKPDNVFLIRRDDGSDFVKVLDFGISKYGTAPENLRITRAGSIIGTPEYMAPEQAAATTVDHRCDIYAFGVLAYEMLTGSLPFQGATALATLIKHQSEPPEPPTRRNPSLSPEVEHFILRALVKRPQGRQQTMAEVAVDLSLALAAVGLGPMHTPAPGSASRSRTSPPTTRFDAPGRVKGSRRQSGRGQTLALEAEDGGAPRGRWHRAAVIAAVSLALGVAAGVAWRWRSNAPAVAGSSEPSVAPVAIAGPPASASVVVPPIASAPPDASPALAAPGAAPPEPAPRVASIAPAASLAPSIAAKLSRLERRRVVLPLTTQSSASGRRTAPESEEDSLYGKVDDLKPDPFGEERQDR
jgi:predicted Ser/Thr protein kinase